MRCSTSFFCNPWLQTLSSRSHKLAIRVFSSIPDTLASEWPKSTASCPIFCTSIFFTWEHKNKTLIRQNYYYLYKSFNIGEPFTTRAEGRSKIGMFRNIILHYHITSQDNLWYHPEKISQELQTLSWFWQRLQYIFWKTVISNNW